MCANKTAWYGDEIEVACWEEQEQVGEYVDDGWTM